MRRRVRRLLALAGAACLVVAAVGPASGSAGAQSETRRPDVFRSSASSRVAQAFLDRETLIPIAEAFRFVALDGDGTYESSNQTAQASVFFPGNAVISGPSLACGTFGGQVPEELGPVIDACLGLEYPLTVTADSLNPSGTTAGDAQLGEPGDPVSGEAVRAEARASIEGSLTSATMTDLSVLGLPEIGEVPLPVGEGITLDSTVLSVDNASSRTDQRIDDDGRLVARAESVLGGVRLLGGLVQIDSIRSVARITDDGDGTTTQDASLEVGGVTVGGVPARITDRGLVVGSNSGDTGPLRQQLTNLANELLGAFDVRVTTLEVEEGVDDAGLGFARASGVLVEFALDVEGLPTLPGPIGDIDPNGVYTGVVQLGQAGTRGIATDVEDPVFDPADVSAPPAGDVAAPPPPPSPDSSPPATPNVAPTPQVAAPVAPDPPEQMLVRTLAEDFGGRVGLVYLAFTLITLATCLAPRFALPARFPGGTRD